ncbi:succinyldiaminopimelate transaminase [Nitratiruptor sp. SB155-2]|uniref:succinyldiaminopimelate transaminase n=1 Tax=Nitratiruptor sp. (strain SB155-2) TaxID=387092 RepID=UPI0001587223|nr:succinyldiaminopimelate transaminase [Nitratiruptor sp. SB155-2]BAF70378.1 aminotransferase, class I and II [Nitratiruptor sp. SB155-2]
MQFEKYPFEKLNELLKGIQPNEEFAPLTLTIGEPQFETPKCIQDELCNNVHLLNKYPKTAGEEELHEAVRGFVQKRFNVSLKPEQLILTFGTREVLFNFPQFLLATKEAPVMAFTNPFYQIYEGAAIASGAKVFYLDLTEQNGFKPQIDDRLRLADLVIINSPNNPTAAVMDMEELKRWVEAALEYDFVLINDECYSEIYTDVPPPSLLEASQAVGNESFENILVVNSISKRSSAPGLRSGFIAGDEKILQGYKRYRAYVGCASPLPLQKAAMKAWSDEAHVVHFRDAYRKNFKIAKEILGIDAPEATFYLWLKVEDDLEFTKKAYKEYNIKVLPGSFLGRNGIGKGFVRIALVYDEAKTKEALDRLKACLQND